MTRQIAEGCSRCCLLKTLNENDDLSVIVINPTSIVSESHSTYWVTVPAWPTPRLAVELNINTCSNIEIIVSLCTCGDSLQVTRKGN